MSQGEPLTKQDLEEVSLQDDKVNDYEERITVLEQGRGLR
jgi:hypothetical protein